MGTHPQIKAWFCKEVYICNIPELRRPKKETPVGLGPAELHRFQTSLSYSMRPCLQRNVTRQSIHLKAMFNKNMKKD